MTLDSTRGRETTGRSRKPGRSGGRPTAAEARRRDERLLQTAGEMFMRNGFDGTSMDAVADAAGVSKRTLYARYADKSDLFRAVLFGLIERWLLPFGSFQSKDAGLEPVLLEIGRYLLSSVLAPHAIDVHRIIVAESERRPEFARLAQSGRQAAVHALAAVLDRHREELRIADSAQAAELFMNLVVDGTLRLAIFGAAPSYAAAEQRLHVAIDLFLNGVKAT